MLTINSPLSANSFKGFNLLLLLLLIYVPSEIRKLPCFDVEIPEHCKHKWRRLYIQYRQDMSNALRQDMSDGDRSNSNEEANQVIKMYKQVSIFQFFFP
jgi:hypothetical protein